MRITNQYIWDVVFIIFFLGILALYMYVLQIYGYRPLYSLTLPDVILITLATFRMIRLFVYDKITAFFREQFWDVNDVGNGEIVFTKPLRGPRRTLAELLSCPWCFGIWAAAMTTFFYLLTPYTFYIVLFLAISAIATFLQICANVVGWKAEQLKKDVEML